MLSSSEIEACAKKNNMSMSDYKVLMSFFYRVTKTRTFFVNYVTFVKVYHMYDRYHKAQEARKKMQHIHRPENKTNVTNTTDTTTSWEPKGNSTAARIWRTCDVNKDGKLSDAEAKECLLKNVKSKEGRAFIKIHYNMLQHGRKYMYYFNFEKIVLLY